MKGIPTGGPLAIIANLTAVNGSNGTFLNAYPASDATQPNASDLNVVRGVSPNLVVVGLSSGSSAEINLFNAVGEINAVIDVDGWFQ